LAKSNWEDYLANLPEKWDSVRKLWFELKKKVKDLKIPAGGPAGDEFELAWNTPKYYLDIDVSDTFSWFFWDKETGEELEEEGLAEPSDELIRLLELVSSLK